MQGWSDEQVHQAAAQWVWLPEGAVQVEADGLLMVSYPDWTVQGVQVLRSRSDLGVGAAADLVAGQARQWGADAVRWWVDEGSRPEGLAAHLAGAGELHEEADLLSFDMTGALPDMGPTPGMRAVVVADRQSVSDAAAVSRAVWGDAELTSEQIEERVRGLRQPIRERGDFRVVVYDETGRAVAAGGCTLAGDVARLWGSGTLPQARGRGAYRALLGERLRVARSAGATLGLVKGRVSTSGPILRRTGFRAHGVERCYEIPIAALTVAM